MLTIISHFYNEEYLLPWWLEHHKKIAPFGVMIDYHSTDRSVEIIKSICPHWEIRTTRNESFDAALCKLSIDMANILLALLRSVLKPKLRGIRDEQHL
jgi:hypothetical protein